MLQRLGRAVLAWRIALCAWIGGWSRRDSLKLIRESTVRYVLADRRGASRAIFRSKCSMDPWQTKRADPDTGEAMVEVQEVGQEEGDRLILVRSRGCAQKEKGIHEPHAVQVESSTWRRLQSAVEQGVGW